MSYINDPSQLDNLQYQYWSGVGENNFNTGYSVNFKLDGKDFTFIPTDVINKGFVDGNTQYFFNDLLNKNNLNTLKEKGQTVDLNGVGWYGDFLKNTMGRDTTGVLIPAEEANKINFTAKQYEIGSKGTGNETLSKITGLSQINNGDFVYQNETPAGQLYQYTNNEANIVTQAPAQQKSGGFLGKVAKVVDKVAPVALAFVPAVGPVLSAAYSSGSVIGKGGSIEDAFKAGAVSYGASTLGSELLGGAESTTDFLGSQPLGDVTTGAVGTGATGIGINPSATIGFNAGAGSLLAPTIESGFGISVTPPAGNFGEFSPYIGSGTTGSSGIGIDTGAATEGYLGAGSATDAASTSGLGYLGGADALPTGTAGITTNVAADAGVSASDVARGINAVKSLLASPEVSQQPTGNQSFVPRGNVNYDPLLNLLTMRASTPNLLSLLG